MHKTVKEHLLHGGSDFSSDEELSALSNALELTPDGGMPWKIAFAESLLCKGATALAQSDEYQRESPKEERAFCSWSAAQLIHRLVEEREKGTLKEALRILAFTEKHVHPFALPALLSSMSSEYELFPYLLKIFGARASWLAKQRKAWQWWINANEPITDDDTFFQWWPKYILHLGTSVKEANRAIADKVSTLDTSEKFRLVKWLKNHPHSSHLDIVPNLLPTRSGKLRRAVFNAMLSIPENPYSKEIAAYVLPRMQRAVNQNGSSIVYTPSPSAIVEGISFKLSDVDLFAEYFSNPQWRLFCLVHPSAYLNDLTASDLHITLMQDEKLERLCQIVICSASVQREQIIILSILQAFLEVYPSGNTTSLQIAPIAQEMDTKTLKSCLEELFMRPSRFFEKLSILLHEDGPYISRPLSEQLAERIHEATIVDLPFNELQHLNRLLLRLAKRLDPRIYPKLRSLWSTDHYMGVLTKNINIFLQTMEQRHRLLESITNADE